MTAGGQLSDGIEFGDGGCYGKDKDAISSEISIYNKQASDLFPNLYFYTSDGPLWAFKPRPKQHKAFSISYDSPVGSRAQLSRPVTRQAGIKAVGVLK